MLVTGVGVLPPPLPRCPEPVQATLGQGTRCKGIGTRSRHNFWGTKLVPTTAKSPHKQVQPQANALGPTTTNNSLVRGWPQLPGRAISKCGHVVQIHKLFKGYHVQLERYSKFQTHQSTSVPNFAMVPMLDLMESPS